MSTQSFAGLCDRMQGKSITRGWDAIVTMNRTKVNSLLEQQYIARFQTDSFLKKISGEHPVDDGYAVLEFTGLLLSQPRLSFINATLVNSKARLTFDVEAGTVNKKLEVPGYPSRVTSSFTVTPQQGYSVEMDIDLLAAPGSVEEGGKVIINLANAYNFSSNLVGATEQEALGQFFHRIYSSYPPELQIYELGTLNFNADDMLVPRAFEIRTQMAPGGNDRLSDSYLDGAVVLFIRTRNNPTNGSTPVDDGDFPYLIPDDRDPDTGEAIYSGSLVLASRPLFDWHVEPFLMHNVGTNPRFQIETSSNFVARSLRGVSGGILLNDVNFRWESGLNSYTVTNNVPAQVDIFASSPDNAFRVFSDNGRMHIEWKGPQLKAFNLHGYNPIAIPPRFNKAFDVSFFPDLSVIYKVVVEPQENLVRFELVPGATAVCPVDWSQLPGTLPDRFSQSFQNSINGPLAKMFEGLTALAFPQINLFHLNHLLFPEQNALLLTEAALPGDLFLAGHIDPKQTAFTLEPLFGRVKTGDTLQFDVKQLAMRNPDIKWSVRGIDGSRASGEISDDGMFTAPDVGLMDDLAVRNVVTATYRDADTGEERTASALVVVVVEPMTVTPSMLTIDVNDASPVALKATVLKDEALKWTLRGPGKLHDTGYDATYTPPPTIGESLQPIEIEVEGIESKNRVIASIILLKGTFILAVEPGFHPGLPAQGMTQLRVDNEAVEPEQVVWSKVAGEGKIDPATGAFTAPEKIHLPYTVVQANVGSGPLAHKGYSIIHLSDYARMPRWTTLDFFRLRTDFLSTKILANGMQQVSVIVEVRPNSVGGQEVDVSDEELASIQLVTKNWTPLKQVGKDGVPPRPADPHAAWDAWGYNNSRNPYRAYQGQKNELSVVETGRSQNGRSRTFYVQTRADTKLEIAAYMRGDNGLAYYSNEGGGSVIDKRLIEITPVTPPTYIGKVLRMNPVRVVYLSEMSTIDYYYLELVYNNNVIKFKTIEFPAMKSIVQWESRQFDEDICSFTGYALEQSSVLNFAPLLYDRMPDVPAPGEGEVDKRVRPDQTVIPGYECPEGGLLISLHRSQYWNFDIGCETDYTQGLPLTIFDVDGNRHAVKINFRTPTDRNLLVANIG